MTTDPAIELPDEIVGERVVLRPYRPGDGAALFAAVDESRDHLAPWMPWVATYRSVDDAHSFVRVALARWLLREDLSVGIFEHHTQRVLGGSGLHRIDWAVRRFEIGYWIRPSAEGRGFVSESVRLLTRLAFERCGGTGSKSRWTRATSVAGRWPNAAATCSRAAFARVCSTRRASRPTGWCSA